jgi:hypothetical protein
MPGLTSWLPASCSRLKIFVCYAHEERKLAEEIAQALTNDGHEVFIDANKLKVSGDFNEDIRQAIATADRFIFLISRTSIAHGKYPQTELGFAQERWPSPQGAVWPVLVDADIDVAQLPIYLRSVQIYRVKGNAPAEIAAEIEKTRVLKPRCIIAAAAAVVLMIGASGTALIGGPGRTTYALLAPQQVDFRPSKKPGPDSDWAKSWLAVTMIPIQYTNEGGGPVKIIDETVLVRIKDRSVPFKWFNEVDMKPNCGEDWLCTKGTVGVGTLKPNTTLLRDTMFTPAPGQSVSWLDFLESVCASKDDRLEISIAATASASGMLGASTQSRTAVCQIDLKAMRENLEKRWCGKDSAQIPLRLSPPCVPS